MPRETLHQYLLRRLAACENHAALARQAGIAQSTMSRIANGVSVPRLDHAQKLLDALEAQDRRGKRRMRSAGAGAAVGGRAR